MMRGVPRHGARGRRESNIVARGVRSGAATMAAQPDRDREKLLLC